MTSGSSTRKATTDIALPALVRIEDLGATVSGDRFFQGIHTE